MGDEFGRNRRYVNEMTEDIEKDKKGPESPGVKRPGKIPLSANRTAIQEEPADRSTTTQNYKSTPDMKKGEPISKSDEVALKKAVSDATVLIKGLNMMFEKSSTSGRSSIVRMKTARSSHRMAAHDGAENTPTLAPTIYTPHQGRIKDRKQTHGDTPHGDAYD